MVRYTQDSWKNDAPSIQANLWGDDPFPAVDSNWDQPSKSFVVVVEPDDRQHRHQHAAVLVLREQDRDHARRRRPVASRRQVIELAAADLPVQHQAVRGGDRRIRCSGAAQAIRRSGTRRRSSTTRICSSSRTTTRKVFGKHFVKAGVLASFNKKNEDTDGNGSSQHSRFWGSAGLDGLGQQHRQHPRRLPAAGHDVRVLGSIGRPLGAAALARPRDVRGRLVAGVATRSRSTTACATRCSTTRTRPTTRSRASCRRSSTRRSATTRATACCSRRAANWCQQRRRSRRHRWAEPLADGPGLQQLRAPARLRLGRQGRRQDRRARRASGSSSCASGSPRC